MQFKPRFVFAGREFAVNKLQKVGIGGFKSSRCCSKSRPVDIQDSGSRPLMLRLEIFLKVFFRRVATNPVVIVAFNNFFPLSTIDLLSRAAKVWRDAEPRK